VCRGRDNSRCSVATHARPLHACLHAITSSRIVTNCVYGRATHAAPTHRESVHKTPWRVLHRPRRPHEAAGVLRASLASCAAQKFIGIVRQTNTHTHARRGAMDTILAYAPIQAPIQVLPGFPPAVTGASAPLPATAASSTHKWLWIGGGLVIAAWVWHRRQQEHIRLMQSDYTQDVLYLGAKCPPGSTGLGTASFPSSYDLSSTNIVPGDQIDRGSTDPNRLGRWYYPQLCASRQRALPGVYTIGQGTQLGASIQYRPSTSVKAPGSCCDHRPNAYETRPGATWYTTKLVSPQSTASSPCVLSATGQCPYGTRDRGAAGLLVKSIDARNVQSKGCALGPRSTTKVGWHWIEPRLCC
jgi:hypothetical protein